MKKILLEQTEKSRQYYIRIEKNEEMFAALKKFTKEEGITFASFTGLGANKDTDYGEFFDGNYAHLMKKEQCELNSLNGNIGMKDGEPMIHAHAQFSKLEDGAMKVYGGHIYTMVSAVTIEISLTAYNVVIERKFSEDCKLNLLDLDNTM